MFRTPCIKKAVGVEGIAQDTKIGENEREEAHGDDYYDRDWR